MKRSLFVAALILTPALLHAQATSPAQPAVLQARAASPAAFKAATNNAAPNTTTSSAVRVSTGVVAPRLDNAGSLYDVPGIHPRMLVNDTAVSVLLTVDASGKPTNVAIDKSAGGTIDQEVLDLVSQYHFQPGTLDGQPFAIPVRLQVVLPRGTQY